MEQGKLVREVKTAHGNFVYATWFCQNQNIRSYLSRDAGLGLVTESRRDQLYVDPM